jgi:hypothetical protein
MKCKQKLGTDISGQQNINQSREYKGQVLLQNHLKTITSSSKDLYMEQAQNNNIIHLRHFNNIPTL